MFAFQNLKIYALSKELVKFTYTQTKTFPKSEQFGLVSQMNRAAISIPSNIAEGSGRNGKKEKIQFLAISYASLMELVCQFEISRDLGFVNEFDYEKFLLDSKDLAVRMNNYKKHLNITMDKQ